MDNQNNDARDLIVKAREALRRGDKETAHSLGEQAALLAPGMEDAWLILTASDPNPEDALAYAQQALEINPSSERALRAVEWAIARLKQAQSAPATVTTTTGAATVPVEQEKLQETKKATNRTWIYVGGVLVLLLCAVLAFMFFQSVSQPAITSLVNGLGLNKVTESSTEKHWAPMSLPKPTLGPAENGDSSQQAAATSTIGPTQEPQIVTPTTDSSQTAATLSAPTEAATATPAQGAAEAPTEAAAEAVTATSQASGDSQTANGSQSSPGSQSSNGSQASTGSATSEASQAAAAPQATETPVVMVMERSADVPEKQPVAPSSNAPLPVAATDGSGSRWIDVDLTNQMVYAYTGDTVINSFLVSTGTWLTPTVTGQYHIYVKYRAAPMSGPGYYLPDVPYIMYFYKGYGLHGTYWHSNFGTPMSHGCVNLRTDEAAWLYNWASVGTLVNVHY
jgi:lipoprotein-anchoring transpeptidase ErfK/SrfK